MRSFNLNDYYTKKAEELLKGYDEYEYDLIKWKDHIPEFGDTKKEIILKKDKDGHEIVKHERFDGNIFQEGTAVNAENLGYMDYGIFMMHGKLKELYEKNDCDATTNGYNVKTKSKQHGTQYVLRQCKKYRH